MKHQNRFLIPAWMRPLSLLLALAIVSAPILASPSNKWRLVVNGSTKAGGEVELSITPEGGTATNVIVAIPARTTENTAASLVRKALIAQFGKKIYKVEIDDGEDVLVKVKGRTKDFDLVVVRNSAEGLSFKLRRE